MAKISLKQLEAFVQISRLGSFKSAAAALNTTQPNISNRITSLETHLGQTLMERDPGSVRLTNVGKSLLEKSQNALAAVEDLIVAAENPKLFEGIMRLGTTETIAHSWLGQFLDAFSSQYENVTVELTVDLSENLFAGLAQGNLDITFQSAPFDKETGLHCDLGEIPLVWVASPKTGISQQRLSHEDISKFLILSHSKNTLPYQQLERHFHKLGQKVRLVPSTSLAACLHMTLQGIGIACIPEAIVKDAIASGELIQLGYEWQPKALQFAALVNDPSAPHYIKSSLTLAQQVAAPRKTQNVSRKNSYII